MAYNGIGGTFKNPLSKSALGSLNAADPSVVHHNGYYYMTFTQGNAITVMKSRTIDFTRAGQKTVWYPPGGTMYSANIWAPEIQYIRGNWYIYFAADDGFNENHRMYAIQADSDDPLGSYSFKGQIADETNKWAIDGLVMEHEDQLYFVWSGWESDINSQQNTYIAPMSDPLSISGPRVLLSEPDLAWEQAGGPPSINEGQSVLRKNGRVFIIYSGAGSWTPYYSLGMLALEAGADPLDASKWHKSEQPLMRMDEAAGVYGTGHNSFTVSPDGKEDWIVYHATINATDGWGNRKARAQRIVWKEDGTPEFGSPLSLDTPIEVPTGSGVMRAEHADRTEDWLTFHDVISAQDDKLPLLIHYRNDTGSVEQASIRVNQDEPANMALSATKNDQTGYAYASVLLDKGRNSVSLAVGNPDVQILAIEWTRIEAENALTEGTAEIRTNFQTSGWGWVDLEDRSGSITFANLNVPAAGKYTLEVAVSNSEGVSVQFEASANGGKAAILTVPPTGQDEWVTSIATLQLNAGSNVIRFGNSSGRISMDYIDLQRQKETR